MSKDSKMSYEEFLKYRLEEAKKHDWFDENGNNSTASANRSIWKSMLIDFKGFNRDILNSVDLKELLIQLACVAQILTLPVTYPFFWWIRSYSWKKRAHKEMKESYKKYLDE